MMGLVSILKGKLKRDSLDSQNTDKTSFEKAINWLKYYRLPEGGIPTNHLSKQATQEVTGYLISTLYSAGEKEFAYELALWEARVQGADGSFAAPDGVPYTFDTAQVIRGFLAVLDDLPELEKNLRRACDYVESQITEEGKVRSLTYAMWDAWGGEKFSEYANLYVLPPLLQAGKKLSEQKYVKAALRGMNYYKLKHDLIEFKPRPSTLSHIFGYMMEALVEMGETSLAEKGLQQAAAIQKEDGAIPVYPGADWVCSTGMAQLAIAWYKLGDRRPADKAMDYLEKIQNSSGGFYGSYGTGSKYFPKEEISWAIKFFLDAYQLRMTADVK